jgi:hypothetical protein
VNEWIHVYRAWKIWSTRFLGICAPGISIPSYRWGSGIRKINAVPRITQLLIFSARSHILTVSQYVLCPLTLHCSASVQVIAHGPWSFICWQFFSDKSPSFKLKKEKSFPPSFKLRKEKSLKGLQANQSPVQLSFSPLSTEKQSWNNWCILDRRAWFLKFNSKATNFFRQTFAPCKDKGRTIHGENHSGE